MNDAVTTVKYYRWDLLRYSTRWKVFKHCNRGQRICVETYRKCPSITQYATIDSSKDKLQASKTIFHCRQRSSEATHKVENIFSRLDKFKKIHCRHENNLASYKAVTLFGMLILVTTVKLQCACDCKECAIDKTNH